MSEWLEFLRSEAIPKKNQACPSGHSGCAKNIKLWTNRGSVAARAVLNKYAPLLMAAETATARKKVEANFVKEMKAVENHDLAEYTAFMNLLTTGRVQRQSPKPRPSVARPPRPSVARASLRNNLVTKIRAEIKKASNARNSWQKQINSLEKKLNEILKKA